METCSPSGSGSGSWKNRLLSYVYATKPVEARSFTNDLSISYTSGALCATNDEKANYLELLESYSCFHTNHDEDLFDALLRLHDLVERINSFKGMLKITNEELIKRMLLLKKGEKCIALTLGDYSEELKTLPLDELMEFVISHDGLQGSIDDLKKSSIAQVDTEVLTPLHQA